jgi:hypothetical protein
MRILILTSCTGAKAVSHERALTLQDFERGPQHVAAREKELAALLTSAEELYTGQQHARLMRGVRALRNTAVANGTPAPAVDLFILSAGYGWVTGRRRLAPYECTFTGMSMTALRRWADILEVPAGARGLLCRKYDLALVLLGDTYLQACALDEEVRLGGTVLFLCSPASARKLPALQRARLVRFGKEDARRFRCGLVGLKGEVAARILELLAADTSALPRLIDPATDLLALLDRPAPELPPPKFRANPAVDRVITIPESWWESSQRARLRYFIPDWDDLVDPDYDFVHDRHSHGAGDWSNNVYAHQLYHAPAYDGLLISRLVAEKSKAKKERIGALGVHRFFRVPDTFPIMGDCGAFGYVGEVYPPYQTEEILDYYTRLGFNFGVSIDHLMVGSTQAERRRRYELTIQNAEDFLKEHRRRGLAWQPIGAVQGWDPASYADAARKYAKMGYHYLALGTLVRKKTAEILRIVEAVRRLIPEDVRLHLFGLARFGAVREFVRLGVTSIDSASVLRRAWLGSTTNFLTATGWYSAVRVPQSDRCFRALRLIEQGERTAEQLQRLERECLAALRAYGERRQSLTRTLLDRLTEYDTLLAGERKGTRERIRRTLADRPWEACGCAICARWGVEVAIFRGNNRNRRRGFHNTHVFYGLIGRILDGEPIDWIDTTQPARQDQPSLF